MGKDNPPGICHLSQITMTLLISWMKKRSYIFKGVEMYNYSDWAMTTKCGCLLYGSIPYIQYHVRVDNSSCIQYKINCIPDLSVINIICFIVFIGKYSPQSNFWIKLSYSARTHTHITYIYIYYWSKNWTTEIFWGKLVNSIN